MGLDETVESIDSIGLSFAESWARQRPAILGLAIAVAVAMAAVFYFRGAKQRFAAGAGCWRHRAARCCGLVLLILADPILKIAYTHQPRPLLYVAIDGTESMTLRDDYPPSAKAQLDAATGLSQSSPAKASRDGVCPGAVQENRPERLCAAARAFSACAYFLVSRRDGVDLLGSSDAPGQGIALAEIAERLTARGQVTNFSAALEDLYNKHSAERLAGVVLVSDFDQNAGPPPAGEEDSPAKRLKVPIYAVGVGPESAVDLKIDLTVPPVIKKGEKRPVSVVIDQQRLEGQSVTVVVTARRLRGRRRRGKNPGRRGRGSRPPHRDARIAADDRRFRSNSCRRKPARSSWSPKSRRWSKKA